MELRYRGNLYQTQANSIQTTVSNQTARFRGQTYRLPHYAQTPIPTHIGIKKYRGVIYK